MTRYTLSKLVSDFDLQCRLASLGFDPGPLDGQAGIKTTRALRKAQEALGAMHVEKLFHPSLLHRIVLHWTAGESGANALELGHYHAIVGMDGRTTWGRLKPEANTSTADGVYAAHTLGLNTGSIGLALDAMAGAVERPFDWGTEPLTHVGVDAFVELVADVARTYWIPCHRVSILTHAEVQERLGVRQKNKWDITVLPGMDRPAAAWEVGDELRRRISVALAA